VEHRRIAELRRTLYFQRQQLAVPFESRRGLNRRNGVSTSRRVLDSLPVCHAGTAREEIQQ
jgi:hypothetical protein